MAKQTEATPLDQQVREVIAAQIAAHPQMNGQMDKDICAMVQAGKVPLSAAIAFSGARRMRKYLA